MARALIVDPSQPASAALRTFLESARYEVVVASTAAEAIEAMGGQKAPDLVFAAVAKGFAGDALCSKLKTIKPLCPVVLIFPADEEKAEDRADAVAADAFLFAPLKRGPVIGLAQLLLRNVGLKAELTKLVAKPKTRETKLLDATRRLSAEVAELKAREEPLRKRIKLLEATAVALQAEVVKLRSQAAPGGEVAFLKQFLPLEVKRSRRYQYPIAVVLVGLDQLQQKLTESDAPEFQRAAISAEAIAGIYTVIRDIDLTIPFADDKYLVLLPHTPREGAMTVASRLQKKLSKMDAFDGGTASAGLACYEPKSWAKEHVSFGGLMRDATAALIKAQAGGGGKVVAAELDEKPKKAG